MLQVAEYDIKRDGGTGMTKVRIAVNGRSANIHTHMGRVDRFKQLFFARERIVNLKLVFHLDCYLGQN
jgi:hypothetical protein